MKYYKSTLREYSYKQYAKVYEEVPENQPERFKKSKLIYIHKITFANFYSGYYRFENTKSYIDKETLDLDIKHSWTESTEEEFNKALEKVGHLEEEFSKIWDQ